MSLTYLIIHQFQLSRLISNRRKNNGLHWLFHRVASLHCQIWSKSTLVCIIKNLGLPMSEGLDATKMDKSSLIKAEKNRNTLVQAG